MIKTSNPLSIFIFSFVLLHGFLLSKDKPVNILFAISDDQCYPYASAYGTEIVKTPAFDKVAAKGVLFNQAFCAAPQCSPSRAAILTGRNIWQLEEAGVHGSNFPIEYTTYTDTLEKNGYHVGYTGKGWGPGNYKYSGRKQNPAGESWSKKSLTPPAKGIKNTDYSENFKDFYKAKDKNQPFCFWYGASEPHRSYQYGVGKKLGKKDPAKVKVPLFLPDNKQTRNDILDYAYEIEWFDLHLGKIIDHLEKVGELENTLIIVTADNGMPFPRSKANLYEHGTHVPLAICWGSHFKKGHKVNTPVSLTQVAATVLEACDINLPDTILGKSLRPLLEGKQQDQAIFTGRERHTHARKNNHTYPCRAIRTENFLLIHNIKPDRWPAGAPDHEGGYYDIDGSPSKTEVLKNKASVAFNLSVGKRPEFELFDIQKDPHAVHNVADHPEYKSTFNQLKKKLTEKLLKDKDPRSFGKGDIFESYPRYSKMRPQLGGFAEQGKYNPKYLQEGQSIKKEDIGQKSQ